MKFELISDLLGYISTKRNASLNQDLLGGWMGGWVDYELIN